MIKSKVYCIGLYLYHYLIKIKSFYYQLISSFPFDSSLKLNGRLYFYQAKGSKITIGYNFIANSKFNSNSIGCFQPCMINLCSSESELIIGDNVGISGSTIKVMKKIIIEDNVMIGSGCLIMDNDSHSFESENRNEISKIQRKEIIIRKNVFIGARCIILKGVEIGENTIISAGSVVTKSIPANCVAGGNPAKILKIN